jgi:hypothetical protein
VGADTGEGSSVISECGHRESVPGARAETDVDACLIELGFSRSSGVAIGSGPSLTLRDFVNRIATGEFSYIWNVPTHVQQSSLPLLTNWCEQTFDLERQIPIPRELHWSIYQKQDV